MIADCVAKTAVEVECCIGDVIAYGLDNNNFDRYIEDIHPIELIIPPNSDVVLFYYSQSKDAPKPGFGVSENNNPGLHFPILEKTIGWRKMLSNFWICVMEIDGLLWNSVEHYYQASKFKKSNPQFSRLFALGSGSLFSTDPLLAKIAGDKSGTIPKTGVMLRPKEIHADKFCFSDGTLQKAMYKAMFIKFTSYTSLRNVLVGTFPATLTHGTRGVPTKVVVPLMKVREQLTPPHTKKSDTTLYKPLSVRTIHTIRTTLDMSKTVVKQSVIDNFHVTYTSGIIEKAECKRVFDLLESNLVYNSAEESKVIVYGKEFEITRKQVGYGEKGTFYKFSGSKVNAIDWNGDDEICVLVRTFRDIAVKVGNYNPNFCLINRYKDGEDKIGAHSDDEGDLVKSSPIVGISLGAEREIAFTPRKGFEPKELSKRWNLLLENGSVFVMFDPTNKWWKHEIPKRAKVKSPRISFTFRELKDIKA